MKRESMTGRVVHRPFAPGSKSEHVAVCLEVGDKSWKLRRADGNPFHDPELEKLVGKRITAYGNTTGYTFIMSEWETIDDKSSKAQEPASPRRKTRGS